MGAMKAHLTLDKIETSMQLKEAEDMMTFLLAEYETQRRMLQEINDEMSRTSTMIANYYADYAEMFEE